MFLLKSSRACLALRVSFFYHLWFDFELVPIGLFGISRTRTSPFPHALFHSSSPIIIRTIIQCRDVRLLVKFNPHVSYTLFPSAGISLRSFLSTNICGSTSLFMYEAAWLFWPFFFWTRHFDPFLKIAYRIIYMVTQWWLFQQDDLASWFSFISRPMVFLHCTFLRKCEHCNYYLRKSLISHIFA